MEIKAATARLTGYRHQQDGTTCQDWVRYKMQDGIGVLSLCDGAGSCAHAEEAASRISEWVISYVAEHFEELYEDFSQDRKKALVEEGQRNLAEAGSLLKEYGCTLLFFAAAEDGRWICGHIGDGVMFMTDENGTEVLSKPENGLYKNETFFLSGADAAEHLRIQTGKAETDTAVLLSSDGCQDALYNWDLKQAAPAVTRINGWLDKYEEKEVEELLLENLADRFQKISEDDLSIGLLYMKV